MLELFADGAEHRLDPFAAPLEGLNALREHWNRVAAEQDDIEFDAERVWVSGRTVLASWHVAITRRATAERVRIRAFSTMELDDRGRVRRMRDWPVEQVVGIDSSYKPHAEAGE